MSIRTNQVTGFGVHLKVGDIEASRAFYESLGFTPAFAYGDEEFRATIPEGVPTAPERYRGLTFSVGDSATLEIAEGHIGVGDAAVFGERITSPKVSAMIKVDSLVPIFDNPLIDLRVPVRHYYWDTVEAVFRDPDGFVIVLIAAASDDELAAVRQRVAVEEVSP